jgi:hypothetical protein
MVCREKMEDFFLLAGDVLSLKYEHLKNLGGLKVLDIRKILQTNLLQGGAITSMD